MIVEVNVEEMDLLRSIIEQRLAKLRTAEERVDLFEAKEEMQREASALLQLERKLQASELSESR